MPTTNQVSCIHELFEDRVCSVPDRPAIRIGDDMLSYAEVNRRSNRLAHLLRQLGVGPEQPVALALSRSLDTMVALLAILKAGGAYLPIDNAYPADRIAFMLRRSKTKLVLTHREIRRSWSATSVADAHVTWLELDDPATQLEISLQPSSNIPPTGLGLTSKNLAYIIFTSGSSGEPKGVLLEHAGLVNLAYAQREYFGVDEASRVLQFASLSFDAATWEWVMALCWGALLCLLPEGASKLEQLGKWAPRYGITHATLPPAALPVMAPAQLASVHTLILAGEACPEDIAAQWSNGRSLWNAYGPTEATVCATAWKYDTQTTGFPIGRPLPAVQVYVLDEAGHPARPGKPGEICIGGVGVARGYLDLPDLTAKNFVQDPHRTDARLYRSGDRGRWREDGNLEFLGRVDRQVKIRGMRVELAEIETTLHAYPDIAQASVVVADQGLENSRLIAYLVLNHGADPLDATSLRRYLDSALPAHMIPHAVFVLPAFSLTINGKIDYSTLKDAVGQRLDWAASEPASTELERLVCRLAAELLEVPQVGATDDFFALGGNSLLASRLVNQISSALRLRLSTNIIFQRPTSRGLAKLLALFLNDSHLDIEAEDWEEGEL